MKKFLLCAVSSLMILGGCSSSDQMKLEDDIKTVEEDIVSQIDKVEDITKEDIQKAVNYIHENIDKAEDSEVAKNLVQAGTYLEMAAKKGEKDMQHDLIELGTKTKDYAKQLYTGAEKEKDAIMKEGTKDVEWIKSKLDEGKDALITEYYEWIHNMRINN